MNLQLSEKHGLNPTVLQCFYCLKDAELLLAGKLRPIEHDVDPKMPSKMCLGEGSPCLECSDYMEEGVILISIDGEKSPDPTNPYRTGGWAVVKEDFIRRVLEGDDLNDVMSRRVAFVPDCTWDALGLPREVVNGQDI